MITGVPSVHVLVEACMCLLRPMHIGCRGRHMCTTNMFMHIGWNLVHVARIWPAKYCRDLQMFELVSLNLARVLLIDSGCSSDRRR